MAPEDMSRIDLDPQLAERLIAGRPGEEGALPTGAGEVAAVLEAARRATTERDDSRMAATVAAMGKVLVPEGTRVGAATGPQSAQPGALAVRPGRPRPSTLPRLLAATSAGLAVLFGGLAAAGALPAAAQKPVADLVSHVGIDLPRPASTPKTTSTPVATATPSTSTTTTTIPVISGVPPAAGPTSETTVTAPPCTPPSYLSPQGCFTPLPVTPTTVAPPPTTSTTAPRPPPTTTTSTTVAPHGGSGSGNRSATP
ncbi:MAG: hypothetical protein JO085_08975 [Acidimicrobiia bacterium]|nr:hypothetical protein [Acidimicrobiia bacterium]